MVALRIGITERCPEMGTGTLCPGASTERNHIIRTPAGWNRCEISDTPNIEDDPPTVLTTKVEVIEERHQRGTTSPSSNVRWTKIRHGGNTGFLRNDCSLTYL